MSGSPTGTGVRSSSSPIPSSNPLASLSPATVTRNLFTGLNAAIPVNVDELFRSADDINIIPGINARFESFVVKCTLGCFAAVDVAFCADGGRVF